MTAGALLAAMVAAAGLLTYPAPALLLRREPQTPPRPRWSPMLRRCAFAAAATVAVGVLAAWPWWIVVPLGLPAVTAAARLPERRSPWQRTEDRRRLAVHSDLLAACLAAGMPTGSALAAIGTARGDPTRSGVAARRSVESGYCDPGPLPTGRLRLTSSKRLRQSDDDPVRLLDGVAALLLLGADTGVAWRAAQEHPDLAGLAAAAQRSADGGTRLAEAVRDHAAILRATITDDAERAAGRAGVAMTAPLGLCFLPAFLCLGLAPVVIGLLGTLGIF